MVEWQARTVRPGCPSGGTAAFGFRWTGRLLSSAVAKPTKPTKRPVQTSTDKVMPTGKPRDAVKRVSRPEDAMSDEVVTEVPDTNVKGDKTTDGVKAAAPKKTSGRVTEKKTPGASTRYTPPTAKFEDMPSPIWVPILMFTMFGLGMLTIFLNYVGLLPNATSNWYLLLGLGFILGGIITATQYR